MARQALAEYLWTFHNLETKVRNLSLTSPVTSHSKTPISEHTPSRTEELEQLEESVPTQIANTEEITQEVLETLKPLLDSEKVTVDYTAQNEPPLLARLKIPIFRQALLSIISMAIRYVPGGKVFIQNDVRAQQMSIRIHTTTRDTAAGPARDHARAVRMAKQLIGLCGGSLEITFGEDEGRIFKSSIRLPALGELQILVIDDNEDTRQLFQRYLSGSRYRFVGAANAADGLELAQKMDPQIIVLDVMMPGKDGWALLGQLRTHPKTCHIPVILCTILPHEGLAHDLGAVDFLQKPVNRPALLSALDRQLSQLGLKPC
jgi:CheY-like chemotaxis protein